MGWARRSRVSAKALMEVLLGLSIASVVLEVSRTPATRALWPEYGALLSPLQSQPEGTNENNLDLVPSLIHIVHTRFMQHQGDLKYLTRARFEQWKSICLPTILHQNSTNFLWIIKTDPNLDKSVRAELVDLLRPHPRFFLVDSLNNYEMLTHSKAGLEGSWRGGQEGEELLKQLQPHAIYTGDRALLQRAYEMRNEVPILETILDADDGLHDGFIDTVQSYALSEFHQSLPAPKRWMYWCVQNHMEWHASINATADDVAEGLLRISPQEPFAYCLTAGLTVGYNIGTADVPAYPHHELPRRMWRNFCDHNITRPSSCLHILNDPTIGVIRSRTVTSAGMKQLVESAPSVPMSERSPGQQSELWRMVTKRFHISKTACRQTHDFIRANLGGIAKDNLDGQCTTGHSCKSRNRNKLAHIIYMAEKAKL